MAARPWTGFPVAFAADSAAPRAEASISADMSRTSFSSPVAASRRRSCAGRGAGPAGRASCAARGKAAATAAHKKSPTRDTAAFTLASPGRATAPRPTVTEDLARRHRPTGRR